MNRTWIHTGVAAIVIAAVGTLTTGAPAFASDNATPTGFHDGEEGIRAHGTCFAGGWTIDPDSPSTDVTVRVTIDGAVVATLLAGEFRQDLLEAGIDDGTAGFSLDLSRLMTSGEAHEVGVEAQDVQTAEWVSLGETPRTITCTHLFGTHDTAAGTYAKAACTVEGWAFDAETPTTRVRVRAIVDGRVIAEATADRFREDVRDAGIGDGYSGWSMDLFGRLTPNRDHTVFVEARDTTAKRIWVPLIETGKTMRCTTPGEEVAGARG